MIGRIIIYHHNAMGRERLLQETIQGLRQDVSLIMSGDNNSKT